MARRKGKSNNKPDESWLPLEPTAIQTRGFNEFVLPGVLFLFVLLVGSGLGWVYNEQQQTIESLSETLASVQMTVSKLHQQVGPSNAQLANVGDLEERLVSLEEAYVKAQRQVEIALATSEQIMSKDFHSKVWSLQTEMNSKLAELQQNTVSIAALNTIIKNKSIELEVVKQSVNTLLTTNSELAVTISGLTNSLSVTKSHLDEHISFVERLVSEQDGQKRQISQIKELFTSNQEELATVQELMSIKELLETKHSKRTKPPKKQFGSLHKSLEDHQTSVKNVQPYPTVQIESDQTESMPKTQQLSIVEENVQVEEHINIEYYEEHTATAHKKKKSAEKETEHTDKQELVKKTTESEEKESTQKEITKEHRTSEEKEMSEKLRANEAEEKTEEHKGRDDEVTEEHGAREEDKVAEKHRAGEEEEMSEKLRANGAEEKTEEHKGRDDEVTEEHGAREEYKVAEKHRAGEDEEMNEEHRTGEEEKINVEHRAVEEEINEEHRAEEDEKQTEEHRAEEDKEMTEEHRAGEEKKITGEEKEMNEEHGAGEEEDITEEHIAAEEEKMTEEHRAGEEEEKTQKPREGEEEGMTEDPRAREDEGVTEQPRAIVEDMAEEPIARYKEEMTKEQGASEKEKLTNKHRAKEGSDMAKAVVSEEVKVSDQPKEPPLAEIIYSSLEVNEKQNMVDITKERLTTSNAIHSNKIEEEACEAGKDRMKLTDGQISEESLAVPAISTTETEDIQTLSETLTEKHSEEHVVIESHSNLNEILALESDPEENGLKE